MILTPNNIKQQIKNCYQLYKETGNGVYKQEARCYYNEYVKVGGKMSLKDIVKSDVLQANK